jgi:hypothetical protein
MSNKTKNLGFSKDKNYKPICQLTKQKETQKNQKWVGDITTETMETKNNKKLLTIMCQKNR